MLSAHVMLALRCILIFIPSTIEPKFWGHGAGEYMTSTGQQDNKVVGNYGAVWQRSWSTWGGWGFLQSPGGQWGAS